VVKRTFDGLTMVEKPILTILINCNNQTVITKVKNSQDNMKSNKHVKRRLKSVRKLRSSGVIVVDYIQTTKNLVDPFTKGLSCTLIDNASKEMGLRPM
jgi:TATA-box binding protein (TBP) (component of TFIID and TFIIIB)